MRRVHVITTWVSQFARNDFAVALDYPASWTDITGQPDTTMPPAPNQVVVYGEVSDTQYAALEVAPASAPYYLLMEIIT